MNFGFGTSEPVEFSQEIVDNLQLEELHNLLEKFDSTQMPDHLWRRLKLVAGQVAELMADFDKALAEYGKALGAKDIHIQAEAYYRRAKVLELQNLDESLVHYKYGIKLLEKVSDHDSLLIKMYIDRAWIFINGRQDLQQAEKNLERAEQLIPQQNRAELVGLHNAWAALLHKKKEAQKAFFLFYISLSF